ncbi:MAG: cyclic nucleotide-binding domain-containing protein [Spirochaetes bacterium]|nr:cyclic nucleotide-binding domain-containing protein [Spirochaetota bacterium]
MGPIKKNITKKTTKKNPVKKSTKTTMKDLKFFKKVALLEHLSDDDIRKVFDITVKRHFRKGNVIMREGENGETMYLFYEGRVEVLNALTLRIGKSGFEETEKSMVKLDAKFVGFFGEMALLQDAPRSATITADSDCILYELSKQDFRDLCKKNPRLGYKLVSKMAEVLSGRIRRSNKDILKLTTALSIALSR